MPVITEITTELLEIPLRHHFATARDILARQVSRPVAIQVDLDDGRRFSGEAVPVQYVTGETVESVAQAIRSVRRSLIGREVTRMRPIVHRLNFEIEEAPTARAGLEMAIYRAHAAALGTSLWRLFGGAVTSVETDITLPIVPDVLDRALEADARGFRIFKLKVGSPDVEEDFERLMAVHEAIPRARFRIDANQAFEPAGALAFIRRAIDHGVNLELVEQPTPKDDLAALAAVAAGSPVSIFADEAVKSPADALRVLQEALVHGINVKLMKSGISGALDIIAIARAADAGLMIGCMLETRRGIEASLALACGTGAFRHVDLDSHLLLKEEGRNEWFDEAGPVLSVSDRAQ